jgi:ribose transport system permease protein
MTRLGTTTVRLLAGNSMVMVLLLLCLVLSAVTYGKQDPLGEAAGAQVASAVLNSGKEMRVLIVASSSKEDAALVRELRRRLEEGNAIVADAVQGEPRDARQALQRSVLAGGGVDVIACTATTASWLLIQDMGKEFPSLASARVVQPHSYMGPTFLKRTNLFNIANQTAVIAIVAIGMTVVIITGGIDLSVGSLIGLSAVTSTLLIQQSGALSASPTDMVLCCLGGIAVCGLFGAGTGLVITLFRVPAFIVTLAVMLIASGLALNLTRGESVYAIPDSFVWLGLGADLLDLPNAVVIMLILYGLAHVVMTRMTLGRYFYAVGGNAEAARLSGVPVQRVLLLAYVVSGLLAGLGGVIMASQLKSGSPTYGAGYELAVIAAVVVGGTSLSGGEGRMFGTLIGAFIIAVIQNGMNLTNTNPFTQKIVLGLVILAAVLLDRVKHRWSFASE